ncbi:uncharacterized protein LOC128676667 [Plodia interpunctella]|uniref:uncharacterized protein LOC128676667 n=1 Tax=Plodia interpunctella TaxID=58824 RepID=UPI0023685FB8|nr:uncharacterized protein LOC128676667 [Plodia interpunctella]
MGWRGVLDFRLLLLYMSGMIEVQSMSDVWVELRGPRYVVHHNSATLRCNHNVDPEALYKVVFYQNGQRIMKFVRGRDPPYELYNVTGANMILSKLQPTTITLDKMDFTASGQYACEIALETPLYSKISNYHEIQVFVRQKHRPKIKLKHKIHFSSENLEAKCQSGPAYPAPHLTWFINNIKVDERLTIPHGTVKASRHHHGMPLSATISDLNFPLDSLQLYPDQTVEITCLSTIPSYATEFDGFADVLNTTVTAKTSRREPAPTQLPVKIISPEINVSNRCTLNLAIIVILLVCPYGF